MSSTPHIPPRILVVDDEQHQLDTVCRGLRLSGYDCRGVGSVEAALRALASARDGDHGCGFDLVLTDLTMPGGSGLALIEQLELRWPALPIVVATGLAATAELAVVRARSIPVLPKPFDPDTLDEIIRRTLG